MPFQFGTNWSRFSDSASNVIGPLMAYEGLTAFFLEASFLGILLFGRKLVPPWAHCFAAVMVAAGTLFSSFWILAANSWMQTPAGYEIIDGRFHALDWMDVIFNPSFPYRLSHVVVAFVVTTGFVVVAVAAHHLRRQRAVEECRRMLSMTLWLLTALVPLQIVLGDMHGLNTVHYQPAKIAAIEGHFETQAGAPLLLVGWPDQQAAVTRWAVAIPKLGSLILTHELNGTVRGLKEWPREDWPPSAIVFWSFRAMVGIGLLMLLLVAVANWLRWKGRLYDTSWFLRHLRIVPAAGFHGGNRRLDHDGGRPAALGDLWPVAYRRCRDSFFERRRCCSITRRLCGGLPRGLSRHAVLFDGHCADWADHSRRGRCANGRSTARPPRARRGGRGCGAAAMTTPLDFVPLWTMILGFGVFMYVLMDGFDLGVGILFRRAPSDEARDIIMNSVAPIWDGNETWLVLGGLGLLAAFPLAFAIILPALYFPILIMLIALIFRGIAFELRFKAAPSSRHRWDAAFHYGSLVATLAQGFVLGAFVQGFQVQGRFFAGGAFDWLRPFSVLTAISLVLGYGLLGATWLIMKPKAACRIGLARRRGAFSSAFFSPWVR